MPWLRDNRSQANCAWRAMVLRVRSLFPRTPRAAAAPSGWINAACLGQILTVKVATHCRDCGKDIPPLPLEAAYCTLCRYGDAPPARAWNEHDANGCAPPRQFEATVDFVYPAEADEPQQDREAQQALLSEFLASFARLSPEAAGRRVLLLSYLAGKTSYKTDAELAERFGISATRFAHLKREFCPDFTSLLQLRNRQRKAAKRKVRTPVE